MDEFIFCKIVEGEIPCYKIAENDKYLAFLDISQFVKGHTLVIPKKHNHLIFDVPDVGDYFEFVKRVGNHFRELGYKYVDTISMGRQVPHAHIHLVPHNNGENDWIKALKPIHILQTDDKRRPDSNEMKIIQKQFQID
jgi:histidine triad (HIT) family protein